MIRGSLTTVKSISWWIYTEKMTELFDRIQKPKKNFGACKRGTDVAGMRTLILCNGCLLCAVNLMQWCIDIIRNPFGWIAADTEPIGAP